jgi:hypothetical protein
MINTIELTPAEEKYYSNDVKEIMREIQLDHENREKRAKEFYKEIKEYHRRNKHD